MTDQQKYLAEIKRDNNFNICIRDISLDFTTTWGLFSPRELDKATELLLREVEVTNPSSILDLGCGYGPIGLYLAKRFPSSKVYMVDKDYVAVDYSKKNAKINMLTNTEIFLSNGFSEIPEGLKFDLIVSNLPAKVGKELFHIWLDESLQRLNPGGELWVVTIAGLKEFVKKNFKMVFGNYYKVESSKGFTVAKTIKS